MAGNENWYAKEDEQTTCLQNILAELEALNSASSTSAPVVVTITGTTFTTPSSQAVRFVDVFNPNLVNAGAWRPTGDTGSGVPVPASNQMRIAVANMNLIQAKSGSALESVHLIGYI
jgi:hypothetical protein